MLGFMIYCAVVTVGIVTTSIVWDYFENNSWQKRVTADDIEQLKRLFDQEGAFVDFNDKGEKFFVGYTKD